MKIFISPAMVATYNKKKIFTIYALKAMYCDESNFLVRLAINSLGSLKPKLWRNKLHRL